MKPRLYQRLAVQMLVAIASVCWLIGPGEMTWGQEHAMLIDDASSSRMSSPPYVALHQGQLTVDLHEADMREVLEWIGRQAGISRMIGLNGQARISAKFADMPLEEGLRRLLQRTSLSHAILYTTTPTGATRIAEVHLFGGTSHDAPRPLPDNTRDHNEQPEVAEQPSTDGLNEVFAAASLGAPEGEAVATHFQGLLSWVAQQNLEGWPAVMPSESTETDGADSAEGMPQEIGSLTPGDTGNLLHNTVISR